MSRVRQSNDYLIRKTVRPPPVMDASIATDDVVDYDLPLSDLECVTDRLLSIR